MTPARDVASLLPPASAQAPVPRLAGADRVATAVDTAQRLYPSGSAPALVVASSTTYADSLAGSRLAAMGGGPLLLTAPGSLDRSVGEQVRRVLAQGGTVFVLGQTSALSPDVAGALEAAAAGPGGSVERLGGRDRYATAAAVAERVVATTGDVGPVYLVTGRDFADGVTVGALAARTGGVVLLTDAGRMPAATAAYLAAHDPSASRVVPVGGPALAAVRAAGLAGGGDEDRQLSARALVGEDRYATAAAVAARYARLTDATGAGPVTAVGVATGADWPDAITASATMGAVRGPLLLTERHRVPAATSAALADLRSSLQRGVVFGGTSAVAPATGADLARLLPGP